MSGRAWPPTAPEFRSLCLGNASQHKTVEAAYAETNDFMLGRISANDLSDSVRHTIYRNMDFYQYRSLSMEKSQEVFRFAYKATIEQFNAGEEPYKFPPPVLKIEEKIPEVTAEEVAKARAELFSMLDSMDNKPQTPTDIKDLERVNKLKEER